MVTAAMKLKDTWSLEERVRQRHYFANKGPSSQDNGFCIVMYECESCSLKKAEAEELILLNCGVVEAS